MGLFNVFTQEIAVDLGTANTLIIHNDKVVVDEPSIVAMDRTTAKVIAIGRKAQQMHGKTHENIKTIRPQLNSAGGFAASTTGIHRQFHPYFHTASSTAQQMTGSPKQGNFNSNYEVVQTCGRSTNNLYLRKAFSRFSTF